MNGTPALYRWSYGPPSNPSQMGWYPLDTAPVVRIVGYVIDSDFDHAIQGHIATNLVYVRLNNEGEEETVS